MASATAPAADVEILREGYDAFARGDIPAVLAVFDPAIEWTEPEGYPWGRTDRGHDVVWEMRDGRAVRFRQYGDTVLMRAAAGR